MTGLECPHSILDWQETVMFVDAFIGILPRHTGRGIVEGHRG